MKSIEDMSSSELDDMAFNIVKDLYDYTEKKDKTEQRRLYNIVYKRYLSRVVPSDKFENNLSKNVEILHYRVLETLQYTREQFIEYYNS